MTKPFLVLSFSLLCTSCMAIAQDAKSVHVPSTLKALAGTEAANKTTAADSRLLSIALRYFASGSLGMYDSVTLAYNPGFGYDFKIDRWKYTTAQSYMYNNGSYSDLYRVNRTFDGGNRIIKSLKEGFNGSQWNDNEINSYTYNTNGNVDTWVKANYTGSSWDSMRYTNTYDANTHLTTQVTEHWDNMTSKWLNQTRTTSTYNAAWQLALELTENWNYASSQWEYVNRLVYTYAGSLLIEALNHTYMGGVWGNYSQSIYGYDANGNAMLELNNTWHNNTWTPSQRRTHTYNSTNDRTSTISEYYTGTGYKNQSKTTTSYNSHHQKLVETQETWRASLNKFEMQTGDSETRYYYEEYTNSVKDAATATGSISVYPVPAKNILNLRTSFTNAEAANVLLTDMGGRIVKQLQLPTSKQYNTTIDVSTLAPGNYTISVNAGGTVMTQKVVVQ